MEQVPASPTVEDMKKLIIDEHITPKFPAGFLAQVHVHVFMYKFYCASIIILKKKTALIIILFSFIYYC